VDQKFIFNLVEEEKLALLLHLPKLFAETTFFVQRLVWVAGWLRRLHKFE
jgi:hypothetical protein